MKKIFLLVIIAVSVQNIFAQSIFDKIKKAATGKDSSKNILTSIKSGGAGKGLSNDDIVNGLREALRVATDSTS